MFIGTELEIIAKQTGVLSSSSSSCFSGYTHLRINDINIRKRVNEYCTKVSKPGRLGWVDDCFWIVYLVREVFTRLQCVAGDS